MSAVAVFVHIADKIVSAVCNHNLIRIYKMLLPAGFFESFGFVIPVIEEFYLAVILYSLTQHLYGIKELARSMLHFFNVAYVAHLFFEVNVGLACKSVHKVFCLLCRNIS